MAEMENYPKLLLCNFETDNVTLESRAANSFHFEFGSDPFA